MSIGGPHEVLPSHASSQEARLRSHATTVPCNVVFMASELTSPACLARILSPIDAAPFNSWPWCRLGSPS